MNDASSYDLAYYLQGGSAEPTTIHHESSTDTQDVLELKRHQFVLEDKDSVSSVEAGSADENLNAENI